MPKIHSSLDYFVRASGRWSPNASKYTFTRVEIWPGAVCSVLPLEQPGYGTGKALGVVTGGGGFNNERIWMSSHTLRFTKNECQ